MHEPIFRALAERCNGINLHAHLQSEPVKKSVAERNQREYQVTKDGIALLEIHGAMMKAVPSMGEGTSTVRLRQQLHSARRDPEVLGALLVLDTPGGTIKGNADLAGSVGSFAAVKPIYAYVEDLCASAGVSVASQAQRRFANQAGALYGSMGTYAVLYDESGAAEKLGVKVHVIRAGEFKGMGEPGTPITQAQLAEWQRLVDALNEGYLALIADGLGKSIEQIRPLADGRIHMAVDAVKLGLIDGVQSFEATYQQLVTQIRNPKSETNSKSQIRKSTMEPATLAELKITFPKSTAEWRESQLEAGATLSTAAIAYAAHVEAKADAAAAAHAKALEAATAKADAKTKGTGGSLGHQPIRARATRAASDEDGLDALESGDPLEDFNAAVARVAGPRPDLARRQQAIRSVASKQPEMYQAYLLACNPGKKQTRMIQEKYEVAGK